jgi:hypothetical protein
LIQFRVSSLALGYLHSVVVFLEQDPHSGLFLFTATPPYKWQPVTASLVSPCLPPLPFPKLEGGEKKLSSLKAKNLLFLFSSSAMELP